MLWNAENGSLAADYIAHDWRGQVVFQALTPRGREVLSRHGCTPDGELRADAESAESFFQAFDAAGLTDFTG